MSKEDTLFFAYLLDGQGGGQKLSWDEAEQWTPDQGILWIHLNYTSRRALQWLLKKSSLDKITVKALIADEPRPRSVISEKGLLVFLRGVNQNPGHDPEDMVSVRTWVDKNCIITTQKRKLLSLEDVRDALDHGIGPCSPADFLLVLATRLLDRTANVVDSIDDQVDELEEKVITAESFLLRAQIADLRRQAISLRRYLAPQRDALSRLYHDTTPFFSEIDKLQLREANERLIKLIEDLDSARERAGVTQEELNSRLSEQLNSRMYVLSVVAVIFLPLSFITGLLGINVGGIPGAQSKGAFLVVTSALMVIMAIMLWLFRRSKWI